MVNVLALIVLLGYTPRNKVSNTTVHPLERVYVPKRMWVCRRIDLAPISARYPLWSSQDYLAVSHDYGRLVMVTGHRSKRRHRGRLIRQLADLQGTVRITDPESALRYARLRTSLATFSLWREPMVEIVSRTAARRLPSYGIGSIMAADFDDAAGLQGIVSDDQFNQLGFSSPVVKTTKRGFEIERWLLIMSRPYSSPFDVSPTFVRERIGRDGAYTLSTEAKGRHVDGSSDPRWMVFRRPYALHN